MMLSESDLERADNPARDRTVLLGGLVLELAIDSPAQHGWSVSIEELSTLDAFVSLELQLLTCMSRTLVSPSDHA